MAKIEIFKNESFGSIRVAGTSEEPLFCALDICNALGYSNSRDALSKHVDVDDVAKCDTIDSLGRLQETTFVSESGLYSLIFGSKLPNAKSFKKWVTSEVLPSIRKTGGYSVKAEVTPIGYTLEDKMKAIELSCKLMRSNKATKARMINSIIAPMGLPTFDYIESKGQKRAAKDLLPHGISSIKFNKAMEKQGLIEYMERTSRSKGIEKYPVITEKGLKFGENEESPEHPGKTQPRWYVDKFNELLTLIGLQQSEPLFQ